MTPKRYLLVQKKEVKQKNRSTNTTEQKVVNNTLDKVDKQKRLRINS